MEGSIIRSKEQWIDLGEKPTKYFYQLEHKCQSCNAISELRVGDISVTLTRDILRKCHTFYSNLYSAEPVDLPSQDWVLAHLDRALTSEDQQKCERLRTLVLRGLRSNVLWQIAGRRCTSGGSLLPFLGFARPRFS